MILPRTRTRRPHRVLGSSLASAAIFFAAAPSAFAGTAYVPNYVSNTVATINTQTNQEVGTPIPDPEGPWVVAITPNAKTAYVGNFRNGNVTVIDTATNQVMGAPIPVGEKPLSVAITPDGRTAYVANYGSNNISVIDTHTNQVIGAPIPVGEEPEAIAITPDGKTAYVANGGSGNVSMISTQTNQVVGAPIPIGAGTLPYGLAITPDDKTIYVLNYASDTVSVISALTNQVVGTPIPVGTEPEGIAITPDGRTAYVTSYESGSVAVINTATNQVVGTPISFGEGLGGIAITPNQAPLASFAPASTRPGVPLTLNASASKDPDGTIASFAWGLGDGSAGLNTGTIPTATHTYAAPGTYSASLAVTDNEGCSSALIFTGQTAYCNGSASATQTQPVTVAYPGVNVKCPKSAKPKGCRISLTVVAKKPTKKKPKPKIESATTKLKLAPGKAAIASLKPMPPYSAALATATKVLVKESVKVAGSQRTAYKQLKVVQ